MASEIIFGQLRLTVATPTIEQINQDREAFLSELTNDNELHKIGLYLLTQEQISLMNQTIENIGREAAAKASNQAAIDVANPIGLVQLVSQLHEKDIELQETLLHPLRVKSKQNRTSVSTFKNKKLWLYKVNVSRANIADYNAELAEKEAEEKEI